MNTLQKHKKNYTQVSNALLNDRILSYRAKGLYAFMDSKPDGWNFTIKSIATQSKEGIDAILATLKELKSLGYINYIKHSNGSGNYELIDDPNTENPNQGIPKLGKSTRISNTKPIVKKINIYELFIKELKEQVKTPSKVTKTKEGEKLFEKIEDKQQLMDNYIAHQLDKKQFAQRITAYMEDYNPNAKPKHYAERLGYIV